VSANADQPDCGTAARATAEPCAVGTAGVLRDRFQRRTTLTSDIRHTVCSNSVDEGSKSTPSATGFSTQSDGPCLHGAECTATSWGAAVAVQMRGQRPAFPYAAGRLEAIQTPACDVHDHDVRHFAAGIEKSSADLSVATAPITRMRIRFRNAQKHPRHCVRPPQDFLDAGGECLTSWSWTSTCRVWMASRRPAASWKRGRCPSHLHGDGRSQDVAVAFRSMEAGAVACVEKPVALGVDFEPRLQNLLQTVCLMSEVKVVRRWNRSRSTPAVPTAHSSAVARPRSRKSG